LKYIIFEKRLQNLFIYLKVRKGHVKLTSMIPAMKTPIHIRIYLVALIMVSLFSCNTEKVNRGAAQHNDLLPEKVIVMDELSLTDTSATAEWLNALNKKALLSNLASAGASGNATTGNSISINPNTFERNELEDTAFVAPDLDTSKIKSILSLENWFFNNEKMCFTKKVNAIAPVLFITIKKHDTQTIKKIPYWIFNSDNQVSGTKNKIKIADSLTTEFFFQQERSRNLDKDILLSQLFKKALTGNYQVRDFFSNEILTKKEIKRRMGFGGETVYFVDTTGMPAQKIHDDWTDKDVLNTMDYSEYKSILFVEDWYLNTQNYSLTKVVKSICPVREYNTQHDTRRSIIFKMDLQPGKCPDIHLKPKKGPCSGS